MCFNKLSYLLGFAMSPNQCLEPTAFGEHVTTSHSLHTAMSRIFECLQATFVTSLLRISLCLRQRTKRRTGQATVRAAFFHIDPDAVYSGKNVRYARS